MISRESITSYATKYHTLDINIAREYVQHLFLSAFYKLENSNRVLFKGGTALRIVNKSPRFSEDLDFSYYILDGLKIESLFLSTLSELEKSGIPVELNVKSDVTSGGYFGLASLKLYEHSISLEINVNERNEGAVEGEYKYINADFAPNYGLLMLPEFILVKEKMQALVSRQKPRDFYDLYFMLRTNMIRTSERSELQNIVSIVRDSKIDFAKELTIFLPRDSHALIKDFKSNLIAEINRQLSTEFVR